MTRTVYVSRSYDPTHSVLGRVFRRWTGDRLRGEAFYLVALTALALFLLMGHYLGWTLLTSMFPSGSWWRAAFWGGQVAALLLVSGIGLIGFRPPVTVQWTADTLRLKQGTRSRSLPFETVSAVDRVSAEQYHRHYRRYAATEIYVSHVPDVVLVLRTPSGPVVVGLPDASTRDRLYDLLTSTSSAQPDTSTSSWV